ncbi:hypothetical protein [Alsobacter sp. SYSU BS001988]|jgi:transposase
MSLDDTRDEIARLEARIESLAEAAERSRKLIVIAKGAAALGGAALLLAAVGVVGWNTSLTVFAIAAMLGGVVISGSSRSSREQALAAMAEAEEARRGLIDSIAPVSVRLH